MTEIRLELVFPSFLCPRISNGLWSFKVYTRFALGSNAALKVRTQGLPCTMHGSPQLQPRSSREGAGFRFRPLKVDDPESFGCEAAEPIRMHSLETRPLSWDSAASSRWRDLMTRGVRTSEHGSGLHHCRRCWLRRPDLALSQATLHCHCFKNPGR